LDDGDAEQDQHRSAKQGRAGRLVEEGHAEATATAGIR